MRLLYAAAPSTSMPSVAGDQPASAGKNQNVML
jgi:hypothetical protein